jgi:hypothetical protein
MNPGAPRCLAVVMAKTQGGCHNRSRILEVRTYDRSSSSRCDRGRDSWNVKKPAKILEERHWMIRRLSHSRSDKQQIRDQSKGGSSHRKCQWRADPTISKDNPDLDRPNRLLARNVLERT